MNTKRVTLLHRNGNVTIRGGVTSIVTFVDGSVQFYFADTFVRKGANFGRAFCTLQGDTIDRVIVVPEE